MVAAQPALAHVAKFESGGDLMRAHVINGGKIVNTVEVESLGVLPGLVAAQGNEGIGWGYDGHTFTAPAPDLTALRAHWRPSRRTRQAHPDWRLSGGGEVVSQRHIQPHAANGPRHDGRWHPRRPAVENHGWLVCNHDTNACISSVLGRGRQ